MTTLVAFSGSDRKDSQNTHVLHAAIDGAKGAGAQVEQIKLSDYDLPIYDGDLEEEHGLPEGCLELKKLFKGVDGFLIASPEYNSGYAPLLKNAIDWVSRPMEGEKPLAPFVGKVAGLVAASPGWRGGMRGLFQLREVLHNISVHVTPTLGTVSNYGETINKGGKIVDDDLRNMVERVGSETAELAAKLTASR